MRVWLNKKKISQCWLGREEDPHGILSRGIGAAIAVPAERDKRRKLGRVRIFTDAQAAIMRMTHDEPGPGQTYALQAIAALRRREPSIEIEIRAPHAQRDPQERDR